MIATQRMCDPICIFFILYLIPSLYSVLCSKCKDSDELKREVEIQEMLDGHPGIVQLDSYCMSKHYSWILLEWIDGGHLGDWSKDNHPKHGEIVGECHNDCFPPSLYGDSSQSVGGFCVPHFADWSLQSS